jgi:hypothetical protein
MWTGYRSFWHLKSLPPSTGLYFVEIYLCKSLRTVARQSGVKTRSSEKLNFRSKGPCYLNARPPCRTQLAGLESGTILIVMPDNVLHLSDGPTLISATMKVATWVSLPISDCQGRSGSRRLSGSIAIEEHAKSYID